MEVTTEKLLQMLGSLYATVELLKAENAGLKDVVKRLREQNALLGAELERSKAPASADEEV